MSDDENIIKQIIHEGTKAEKLELFGFEFQTPRKKIRSKFKLFARACYPRFFDEKSADFHDDVIMDLIMSYISDNKLVAGFRGCAKTSLAKLFIVFVLLNDKDEHRKYLKVLTKELKNAKQIVTDSYNLILEVSNLYGDQFAKEGDIKREETMGGYTMRNGTKISAGTIGQTQRGHVQDAYRPDWILFDDTEDVKSISSMVITQSIIESCAEAIKGLSLDGSFFVSCNYISDQGVVQWFMNKASVDVRIIPLLTDDQDYTSVTWPAITPEMVEKIVLDCKDDPYGDFYGEYQCDPQKSQNKFFDMDRINKDLKECKIPVRVSSDVNYWDKFKPNHRYGLGSDHSEGIGLDSNTFVLFDFTTGEVVASYANNEITPDLHAHECARIGAEFGNCIWAPEANNKCGGIVVTTAKDIDYPNLYRYIPVGTTKEKKSEKFGWETNRKTKYNMLFDFKTDYNDGLIKIYDKNILAEMKAYTNNDLNETQTGLITRHFDLLMGAAIGWQMKKHAIKSEANTSGSYKKAMQKYLDSNK